jgi:peptidyl-prolyl cis-trans isomerase C
MTFTSSRAHLGAAPTTIYRRWPGIIAALALPLVWSGCSPAPQSAAPPQNAASKDSTPQTAASKSSGAVIAKVDGTEIRETDLAMAEEDIGQNMPPMAKDAKQDYLVAYVADMILIAKAAEAKKIDQSDDFKRQMNFIRNKLLMETVMQAEGKNAVSDAELRKVYDDATKQMKPEEEVRARHILVETDDEAKAILEELKKGADFATLAKEKSKDPGGAAEGGDLGYFTKEQMVPEFADVAFKMEKGQLSGPVKSQFGWHIIQVEDKRMRPVPDFDKVRSQIENFVMRKGQAEYVTKLRQAAKIERFDTKPEAAAADTAKPDVKPAPAEPEKK